MERIRKAIMAGFAAGVSTAIGAIANGGLPSSPEGWSAFVGGILGAFALAAWATWRIPNEEPLPTGTRRYDS